MSQFYTGTLARKPETMAEARSVRLATDVEPHTVPYFEQDDVTLASLDALIKQRGLEDPFVVLDRNLEEVIVVSPDGYDYVRYLGRLANKDARELRECRAAHGLFGEEQHKPEPQVVLSSFESMSDTMRQAYEGCEGDAQIAFLGDPNDDGVWQFALIVDTKCLQIHYTAMNNDEAVWDLPMIATDIALIVARRLGPVLRDAKLGMLDCLDVTEGGKVDELIGSFGLRRIL